MGIDSGANDHIHKPHRSRQAGPKKKAKSGKKKREISENEKKQNPKVYICFN